MHHEVELGVLIGKKCSKISESEALDYIGGYTLALDMTARDLQDKLKVRTKRFVLYAKHTKFVLLIYLIEKWTTVVYSKV